MEFMEALNELAAKIGIGRIVPDDTGSVTLLFDGKTEVSFTPDADESVVYLQSEIADASSLGDGDCRSLMEASLSDTDGAALPAGRRGLTEVWRAGRRMIPQARTQAHSILYRSKKEFLPCPLQSIQTLSYSRSCSRTASIRRSASSGATTCKSGKAVRSAST